MKTKLPEILPIHLSTHSLKVIETVDRIINYLKESEKIIEKIQAQITNLRGGYTDAEIAQAAFTPVVEDNTVYSYPSNQKVSPVVEKWPKEYDKFFYIGFRGHISESVWYGFNTDRELKAFGNCFRTRAEAEEKLAKITKVLGE